MCASAPAGSGEAQGVAEAGAALARAVGMPATPEALGAPHGVREALARRAQELDAAAIVVGSHGRGAIGRALLSSVSSGLTSHALVPVLVIP